MRAVDTNILIHAEITSSRFHARAREVLTELAEGAAAWAVPWTCVYEFLRVVTHSRVYHPPVPSGRALEDLQSILESPSLVLLSETSRHAAIMQAVIADSGVTGNLIHDAHIAALCIEHGVSELITGDRDFLRFEGIRLFNPFA